LALFEAKQSGLMDDDEEEAFGVGRCGDSQPLVARPLNRTVGKQLGESFPGMLAKDGRVENVFFLPHWLSLFATLFETPDRLGQASKAKPADDSRNSGETDGENRETRNSRGLSSASDAVQRAFENSILLKESLKTAADLMALDGGKDTGDNETNKEDREEEKTETKQKRRRKT